MAQELLKILVVEDEDDIAHFTCKILEREGFSPFKALDGTTALDFFEKERPSLLMLDLDLGYSEIEGIEVLEKIKKEDSSVECIMITRVTEPEMKEKVKALGVSVYLNKPLYPEDWLPKIHEAAKKIRARD